MGEPMSNFRAVVGACKLLNDGFGISAGNVTISTVGLPNSIRKLVRNSRHSGFCLHLSLSLFFLKRGNEKGLFRNDKLVVASHWASTVILLLCSRLRSIFKLLSRYHCTPATKTCVKASSQWHGTSRSEIEEYERMSSSHFSPSPLPLWHSSRQYPFEQLLRDCYDYFELTGKRVTFEYTLLGVWFLTRERALCRLVLPKSVSSGWVCRRSQ